MVGRHTSGISGFADNGNLSGGYNQKEGGRWSACPRETAKEAQRGESLFFSGRQDGRGPLTALSCPSNDYLIMWGGGCGR